jgi:hypothetical protein
MPPPFLRVSAAHRLSGAGAAPDMGGRLLSAPDARGMSGSVSYPAFPCSSSHTTGVRRMPAGDEPRQVGGFCLTPIPRPGRCQG